MPAILTIVFGIIAMALHAIDSRLAMLAAGAVCGLLLGRLGTQQALLKKHRQALDELIAAYKHLAGRLDEAAAPVEQQLPAAAVGPEPDIAPMPALTSAEPVAAAPLLAAETTVSVPAASPTVAPAAAAAPRTNARPAARAPAQESGSLPGPLRWLLTGNPVAKLGVLLLFFGLAYLFNYASERNMLPIELRLGGAVILSGVLLAIGWRLRVKQALYGLLLQGAAVGSLYIIIFAAYRLYDLLPQPLTFGLMLVVCAASVALAVLQKAQGLAMAASLGGFMAPLLLSTGQGNAVGLFSYYLLLSGGILVVSLFQSWRSLNVIGFFFTFGVGGIWGVKNYTPAMYVECQAFLVAFLLIYGVIALLFAFRQPAKLRGFVDGTLVFGSPLVGFGLQYGLTRHWEFGPAFSALAFAAFYLPLAAWLLRKRPQHTRLLTQSFFVLGLSFVTLALPLGLDASWTALAWVLEGAGLIWVGAQQAQRRMVWSGVALQLAAAVAWLIFMLGDPAVVAGSTGGLVLALAWMAGGLVLSRPAVTLREGLVLSRILLAGGLLWWISTLPWALEKSLRALDNEVLSVAYVLAMSASAIAWHAAARAWRWRDLGHGAWLLWPVLLLCTGANAHPLQDWSWLAWPLALASALWLLRRREQDTNPHLLIALHATLFWLLGALLIDEGMWRLNHGLLFVQEWAALPLLALPAVLIGAVVYGVRRRVWPFATFPLAWLVIGAAPLLILSALGLVYGNFFDGRVRELGMYLPLLNPLELAAAAALLAVLAWLRQLARTWPERQLPADVRHLMLVVLAFWWGNGVLLRLLSSAAGVDWTADALWASRLVQTSMALAWTLCAMFVMWKAAQRGWRLPWIGGALLLAVVVVKLMLVDSASGGGLARAVAFIGVALLLLLIGYLAPLPPRPSPPLVADAGDDHV